VILGSHRRSHIFERLEQFLYDKNTITRLKLLTEDLERELVMKLFASLYTDSNIIFAQTKDNLLNQLNSLISVRNVTLKKSKVLSFSNGILPNHINCNTIIKFEIDSKYIYQEGTVEIPLTGLILPHCCACPKPGPEYPTSYVMVFCFLFTEKW